MDLKERAEKNEDAFLHLAPRIGKFTMRPFSTASAVLARRFNLRGILAPQNEISDEEKMRHITAFLFIQCAPKDDVKRAAEIVKTNPEKFWDDILLDFEMELPVEAIPQALEELQKNMAMVSAADFQVVQPPSKHQPGEVEHPNG